MTVFNCQDCTECVSAAKEAFTLFRSANNDIGLLFSIEKLLDQLIGHIVRLLVTHSASYQFNELSYKHGLFTNAHAHTCKTLIVFPCACIAYII